MPWFRHPYLVRGVVHTPLGAFRLDRGLADVPERVGEALGWQLVIESDHAVSRARHPAAMVEQSEDKDITNADRNTASGLESVLLAASAAIRGRTRIDVPDHGIYVTFNDGLVATCTSCHVSWEVRRRQFKQFTCWRCPTGCRS